jgi:hypothetical protein
VARSSQFIRDKITNGIEEIATGQRLKTEIIRITQKEVNKIHKKNGWSFNWKQEFKERAGEVYKLVIEGDDKIQGLISIEPRPADQFIELHLIESAPFNRGRYKKYDKVATNMVAFACKMSFNLGYDGFVIFTAKTRLIQHYIKTLGAEIISGNKMVIFTPAARTLVNSHYEKSFN